MQESKEKTGLSWARRAWRIWAKALGSKESTDNREADKVAIVRTFLFVFVVITELHIIANVWLNHF